MSPRGTYSQKHNNILTIASFLGDYVYLHDTDRDHLLLYELVPVLLDKVPGKQVASEAITHSLDNQRQLLRLDGVPLKTSLQNPRADRP